jgi:catechol 2,3-dioxygenase-like lactoylglutathione lyase family enzyme
MRLDHIAYRVKDRSKTATFFEKTLGYTVGTEFQVKFDDGSTADCLALVPPEKRNKETSNWVQEFDYCHEEHKEGITDQVGVEKDITMHAPPEIFVSDGPPGSIVGDWVAARNNIGGVHHIAYMCDDIDATMKEWKVAGFAEFLSDEPMTCPGLVQVFTKPSELTGVIYELISRKDKGFCKDNVKNLMLSTSDI